MLVIFLSVNGDNLKPLCTYKKKHFTKKPNIIKALLFTFIIRHNVSLMGIAGRIVQR